MVLSIFPATNNGEGKEIYLLIEELENVGAK
jgi:hypothetical protein